MKKLSGPVALVALLALPLGLRADSIAMVKSTTPTTVSLVGILCNGSDANSYTLMAATGQTASYPTENADTIRVHVFSDAGSTSTVTIEQSLASGGPWFVVATITNPSATGELWSLPRANYTRVKVTAYTNGNIRACISAWRGGVKVY